jgi:large subunit ribosomal protein L18
MRIKTKKEKRAIRVRSRVKGSKSRPRLSVFRSNKHLHTQLIDDDKGVTLASFSDAKVSKKDEKTKTDIARAVGEGIAKKAKAKKIKSVIFDRGSSKYHGRIKAVAEGARKGGLNF